MVKNTAGLKRGQSSKRTVTDSVLARIKPLLTVKGEVNKVKLDELKKKLKYKKEQCSECERDLITYCMFNHNIFYINTYTLVNVLLLLL